MAAIIDLHVYSCACDHTQYQFQSAAFEPRAQAGAAAGGFVLGAELVVLGHRVLDVREYREKVFTKDGGRAKRIQDEDCESIRTATCAGADEHRSLGLWVQ